MCQTTRLAILLLLHFLSAEILRMRSCLEVCAGDIWGLFDPFVEC